MWFKFFPNWRYVYCTKCFSEIQGDMITIGDDSNNFKYVLNECLYIHCIIIHLSHTAKSKKVYLLKWRTMPLKWSRKYFIIVQWYCINACILLLTHYRMVSCVHCGRRMHRICVLYFEPLWPEGLVVYIIVVSTVTHQLSIDGEKFIMFHF